MCEGSARTLVRKMLEASLLVQCWKAVDIARPSIGDMMNSFKEMANKILQDSSSIHKHVNDKRNWWNRHLQLKREK